MNQKNIYPHIVAFIITILSTSIGSILLKIGAEKFEMSFNPFLFIEKNYIIISGYFLYLIPTFLTIYLYKFYKIGLVQGILALVYIITPALAFMFDIEEINFLKVFGILIVFSGVLLIIKSNFYDESH